MTWAPWSEGDRVYLVTCTDEHTGLRPGDRGTVSLVDDLGTVHVNWDTGYRLGMVEEAGDRIARIDDVPSADDWPAGKTLGELDPQQKAAAVRRAAARFQAELTASAPGIARVLEEFDAEQEEPPAAPGLTGYLRDCPEKWAGDGDYHGELEAPGQEDWNTPPCDAEVGTIMASGLPWLEARASTRQGPPAEGTPERDSWRQDGGE